MPLSLSQLASSELRQITSAAAAPSKTRAWTTALLVLAAAGGIAAGFIPKKKKALRKAAIGTSVGALAGTAILFAFSD